MLLAWYERHLGETKSLLFFSCWVLNFSHPLVSKEFSVSFLCNLENSSVMISEAKQVFEAASHGALTAQAHLQLESLQNARVAGSTTMPRCWPCILPLLDPWIPGLPLTYWFAPWLCSRDKAKLPMNQERDVGSRLWSLPCCPPTPLSF